MNQSNRYFISAFEGSALAEGMSSNSQVTCHSGILARFLSLSGHVALRHLVHLDVGVQGEIKRRQAIEESEKENAKQAQKTRKNGDQSSASCTKVEERSYIQGLKLKKKNLVANLRLVQKI